MILFYYFLAVILCFIVGISGCKLLNIQNASIFKQNSLIYIVFGLLFYISALELFGLVFPISLVSIILLCVTIFLLLYARDELKRLVCSLSQKQFLLIIVFTIPAIIISLDQIVSNEFFTILGYNSDFAYYLSSIEWLKNHRILEAVEYSTMYPFYSLADFMLTTTRIGMDLFGAYLSNIYRMDAYEILPIIAMVSVTIISIATYSVVYLFTENKYCSLLFGVYCGVSGNTIALIADQYYSQVIGMGCFVLSVATMFLVLTKPSRENSLICGLFVGGLMSIYCEYAVYIVLISIVMLIMVKIKYTLPIKNILYAVFAAVVFNLYGIYKAILFNVNILSSIISIGNSSIDPYNGQTMDPIYVLWTLVGGTSKHYVGNYEFLYFLLAFLSIIAILYLILLLVLQFKNISLLWTPIVISVTFLGVYFHVTQSAYQEFKHITSMSVLVIALLGIVSSKIYEVICNGSVSKSILTVVLFFLSMLTIVKPAVSLTTFEENVDLETLQLRNAVEVLCANEPIQINGTGFSANQYMSAVYALKDHPVYLSNDIEAYFQFFQNFQQKDSTYKLYPRGVETRLVSDHTKIVWCNDKYVLVEDSTIEEYNRMDLTAIRYGWGYGEAVDIYEEADCIVAHAGPARYILYGPYTALPKGTYDFILEYDAGTLSGPVGTFDVYCKGEVLAQIELQGDNCQSVVLKDVKIKDTYDQLEFRVFANEGVELKVEGISWKESTTT